MSVAATPTRTDPIARLPKVELHRHLAGCVTPKILLEVARLYHVSLPAVTVDRLRELVVLDRPLNTLQEVLERFAIFAGIFENPAIAEYVAGRIVEDAARDNIRYLELRFSPGFLAYAHGLSLEEVTEAVIAGSQTAARKHGVVVPLLAIASREMGPEVCANTFRLAARYRPHIVGVDLAGDEDGHPPALFARAFDRAHADGLKVTVHAGEQSNPENVRTAVEQLHADRIGHGIRIVDQPDIMALLADRNVPLEISITSNWLVGAVPSVEEHPVCRLRDAGVPVTINSDDPALFGITLSSELALYARLCGLTIGDLVREQMASLDYGFAPDTDRGLVREQIHAWWTRA